MASTSLNLPTRAHPHRTWLHLATLVFTLSLAACSKNDPTPRAEPTVSPAAPAVPTNPLVAAPDVGKIEVTTARATGFGKTAPAAVAEAMRLAVLQVNGASLDIATVNSAFGVAVALDQTDASIQGSAFSETVRQRSGGLIQNFKILELVEPTKQGKISGLLDSSQTASGFKATIEASIGKYTASVDLKKIKLVIAPLRFDRSSIVLGDKSVPANVVGDELRQRIQAALLNTGRFAILDREFSPEIQAELEMISSGESPQAEMAKLSQVVSADIVWIGRVNNLSYNKLSKQLVTSDRELVSYSGGWTINQKLVTVATKQVMTSDVLRGTAPSTEPTTLSRGVNANKILGGMTDDLVNQVVGSILSKTFPISVVAIDGNDVVLSQGGQALTAGARYAVAALGNEIKDPQTGQSLGRVEKICCELIVDRVAANLSYGRLEKTIPGIEKLPPGSLLVKARLTGSGAVTAQASPDASNPTAAAISKPAGKAKAIPDEIQNISPPTGTMGGKRNDDKW